MSNDAPATKVTLDTVRDWLIATTRLFAKFAAILFVLAGALMISFLLHLPLFVSYSLVLIIAAVLFIMLIMVSIKNIVYLYLKSSVWGQIVLYLLVALISARSYLWAIGEINRIFLVNPSHLSITTTVLTAIAFFRHAIIALLASYLLAIGLYFYYKHQHQSSLPNLHPIGKRLTAGAAFVGVVSLSLFAVGNLSKYSDQMIQAFAINIDFYTHHTCTGDDFEDIDGILFLSASDILVAKKVAPMAWRYKKVKCDP